MLSTQKNPTPSSAFIAVLFPEPESPLMMTIFPRFNNIGAAPCNRLEGDTFS
jgi:hypothetical protein